jgi:hypothetical protein
LEVGFGDGQGRAADLGRDGRLIPVFGGRRMKGAGVTIRKRFRKPYCERLFSA